LFTLYVNDFGIKYVGLEHTNHLAKVLEEHYKCSIDWDRKCYLGINMDWDYKGHRVHILVLDYVPEALARFQHRAPSKPQHQPCPHVKPNYRAKVQYTEDTDTSALLPQKDKKFIQKVIGTFLYYAQCVDSTMLVALGSIATQQANPTENTMKKVRQFLDYASTHPDAIVTYHTSDTSLNQRHAAGQVDISSCPATLPNHQTMVPSLQLHRLSRQSNVKHYLINYPISIWVWADIILSFFSVNQQSNRTRAI
jgi:hypothetical protein